MRHHYSGDEGDLTKFALLNALRPGLRVGLNWYLTEHAEEGTGDGEVRRHLDEPEAWAGMSGALVARFGEVFDGLRVEDRHVRLLEDLQMVGADTVFFGEALPTGAVPVSQRVAARQAWHQRALAHLAGADLVFFDPDNGLQVRSVGERSARRCKYATYAEVGDYLDRGQAVVCYQHARRVRWADLVPRLTADMRHSGVQMARPGFIAFGTRGYLMLARDQTVVDSMVSRARAMRDQLAGDAFSVLTVTVLPEAPGA